MKIINRIDSYLNESSYKELPRTVTDAIRRIAGSFDWNSPAYKRFSKYNNYGSNSMPSIDELKEMIKEASKSDDKFVIAAIKKVKEYMPQIKEFDKVSQDAKQKVSDTIKKWQSQFKMPEGFKFTSPEFTSGGRKAIINNKDTIKIEWSIEGHLYAGKISYMLDGSTNFKNNKGWFSFDRIGVESSFYVDSDSDGTVDLNKVIPEQIKRAEDAIKETKSYVKVPTTGFTISPDSVKEMSNNLKAGKTERLTPSGFGIELELSSSPKSRYAKKGPTELAKFFGLSVIYVEEHDRD